MEFIRIFEDKVSDCYNIVKIPNDVCLSGVNKPLPEYVLTAEITDYFMNLCPIFSAVEAPPTGHAPTSAWPAAMAFARASHPA